MLHRALRCCRAALRGARGCAARRRGLVSGRDAPEELPGSAAQRRAGAGRSNVKVSDVGIAKELNTASLTLALALTLRSN